jgi:hypothetical protein
MNEYPTFGTAQIECATRKCGWVGTERDLVPDPNHKPAPRGRLNAVKNVCPACHRVGYYFVKAGSGHV